jgi:membrane-bound lytic murein transglycosylase D
MKRLLQFAPLMALAACAGQLPPAPSASPVSTAVHDSLVPVVDLDGQTHESSAADAAVLNDLAETAPDAGVPSFDASGVRWDIDVRTYASHPRVQFYLDYFQRAHGRMAVFLSRGARYEALIRSRFQAEGLPGDLGYLALIESGYSNEAVSRAYAVGMWQFMRGTGAGYGLRVDSWVDERRDPVKATDAAARHLRDLRQRFGSLYLAAAAYNAGAGKVSRSLGKLDWDAPAEVAPEDVSAGELEAAATDGDSAAAIVAEAADSLEADPADSLDEDPDEVPAEDVPEGVVPASLASAAPAGPADGRLTITSDAAFFRLASNDLLATETQDYVPKLIAAALIAKQPERYGFTPVAPAPLVYDSLVVEDATGLDVVARLAGASLAEIRELNPQYLRLVTPPRSTMVVRLPAGSGPRVAAGYARLSPKARVHYLTYVTRRGDRMATIAARHHLPLRDLQAFNPKVRTTRPARGTRLVIPAVAVPSALAMRATGTIGGGHRAYAGRGVHRVRRGETLTGIARRYRVSVRSLQRVNALRSSHAIRPGMRLRIPA